jgi:PIN domain nuclease of toxin-antitoxin system
MEIATKHRIGKLPEAEALVRDLPRFVAEQGFDDMPITGAHALRAGMLAIPHRDPFDRLLIAQSQIEQAPLVSNESAFDQWGAIRLW